MRLTDAAINARRWKARWTLCALAGVLTSTGCARTITRETSVVARYPLLPPRAIPPNPAFDVTVQQEADAALVDVNPMAICQSPGTERQVLREVTTAKPRLAGGIALMVVGAAVAGTTIIVANSCRGGGTTGDDSCIYPFDTPLIFAGTGLFLSGAISGAWSLGHSGQSSRTFERVVPVAPPAPACVERDRADHRVELACDSGLTLTGRTDDRGVVRLAVPDSVWGDHPGNTVCLVQVDGLLVGKTLLRETHGARDRPHP